jgi:hypothetical protein
MKPLKICVKVVSNSNLQYSNKLQGDNIQSEGLFNQMKDGKHPADPLDDARLSSGICLHI